MVIKERSTIKECSWGSLKTVITLYDAIREDVWCYAFGELRSLIQ